MNIAFDQKQLLKRIEYFSSEKNQNTLPHRFASFFLIPFLLLMLILSLQMEPVSQKQALANPPMIEEILNLSAQTDPAPSLNTEKEKLVASVQTEFHKQERILENPARVKSEALEMVLAQPLPNPDPVGRLQDTIASLRRFEAIPVSFTQVDSTLTAEVVLTEENSLGKMVTRVFRITQLNGEIFVEPLWMLEENRELDSLKKTRTDTISVPKMSLPKP